MLHAGSVQNSGKHISRLTTINWKEKKKKNTGVKLAYDFVDLSHLLNQSRWICPMWSSTNVFIYLLISKIVKKETHSLHFQDKCHKKQKNCQPQCSETQLQKFRDFILKGNTSASAHTVKHVSRTSLFVANFLLSSRGFPRIICKKYLCLRVWLQIIFFPLLLKQYSISVQL